MQSMVSHGTTTIAPTPTAYSLFIYLFFSFFFLLEEQDNEKGKERGCKLEP